MRWYVARDGKSIGPVDEDQVIAFAREGKLAGAMVRDEHSSAWIPIEQSPFAPAPRQSSSNLGAIVVLVVFLGCIGFLWYSCNSFKEFSAKQDREQKAEQAAEKIAQGKALKRYSAIMAAMTKDPPATLKDVQATMGRTADKCEREENQTLDVCFWFLTSDSSLKVFSYTLAAENLAGTDPNKWVKLVVFGRDGKVERKIDGAIQQLLAPSE